MKKVSRLGILIASLSMATGVITFSAAKKEKELLFATDLPEDQLYVAPAAVSPYTYTTSPTNEPWYSDSHYFKNTATASDGASYQRNQKTTMYDFMNVTETWKSYRGENVKVAVIDTGCYTSHEDFNGTNIKTISKNMVSGTTGLSAVNDTNGHGTTSAATIAAAINGVGGSGIAPNVDLVILKCVDSNGAFSNTAINNALQYCIDNDVDVINMSIQGYNVSSNFSSSWFEDFGKYTVNTTSSGIMTPTQFSTKLKACHDAGITLVAAAGNYNTDRKSYPAANDYVIAVGSTGLESATSKAGYSNYGDWLDISAPGYVSTPSITGSNQYSVTNGTSFSAPLVTGAIALYKSKYPSATPDEIEAALKSSAQSISWQGGAGALDVGAFLATSPETIHVESLTLSEHNVTLSLGDTYQIIQTILPEDADQNVTYLNYDDSVCTVDENGLVTAIGEGESFIEVTSAENSNISDTIYITVSTPSGDPKTVSKEWDLSSTSSDWTASGNEAYFSQPYGFKKANGTLVTTNSIEDFSKQNKTEIVIGFKCLQNGGTSSRITIYLYDSDGNILDSQEFTPTNANDKAKTVYCEATFTTNLTKAAKFGMKVTTFGKNILVNGAKYKLTYLESGSSTTKTLSSISLSGQKTEFSIGETWSFGGTVTANYSDNSHADVTSNATFSGNLTYTTGTKTVTVSYTEGGVTKTATYNITVSAQTVTTYKVTYNGNGNTSGSVPTDSTSYNSGASVTIKGNTGNLVKTNYTFKGWNTKSDGTGTSYTSGNTFTITTDTTLYAIWESSSGGGDGGSEYQYYSGNYYSSITNSQISTGGTELISALKTLIQPNAIFGYSNIWTFNENYDKYPSNYDGTDPLTGNTYPTTNNTQKRGKMWDMYSDQTWAGSSQRCGSYSTIGDAYNREHSLPKSWFGGSDSNQPGTDPNHLFNTDGKVNGMRSNYPYGEVVKDVTFDGYTLEGKNATGFGKLGKNSSGDVVFEPDDAYKGDFARAQMYMATAYYNWNLTQGSDGGGAYCFTYSNGVSTMKSYYINLLTKWSAEDPVSQKEIDRNNAVYNSTQKNRNPFIDHPTWANKIWGGTTYTWNGKSSGDETINVTSVSLNKTSETISVGEELTLIPTIAPDNASNKSVTWSSSDETVATVNNGVVTGVSAGESTITVTTADGNKTATCLVKVETQGSSDTVTASIDFTKSNSSDEDNIGNVWTASGSTETGSYLKMKSNTTNVKSSAITLDTTKTIKVSLNVGYFGGSGVSVDVYAVNSSGTTISTVLNLSPTTNDNKTYSGALTINSSDNPVNFVINAKGTSSSGNGKYVRLYGGSFEYSALPTVPKVTDLSLTPVELSFDLYNDFSPKTIIATVTADEGADETVTWTSDNETVATVEGGIVTPHAKGTATITAKAGDIEKTCSVTVNDSTPAAVSGITLDKNSISLTVGQTTTLTATVLPSNAGNKNISWSTSNSSIATVDNGFVTTLAAGTVYITATTEEGGFTATCTITVSAAPVITYELVADETVFSYMSGTNHTVSVGVKLYEYTNGENRNQVTSGTSTVDTSSLGQQDISFEYQSTTYTTKVKVTNDKAEKNVGTSTQGSEKTETLTSALFAATTNSYVDFVNVSVKDGTGAIYAGNSAKDASKNIQLRSKNSNSGIVQTASGGKVTKIKINVGSGTGTINVYGKNTAYSSAADLYGNEQGTLIGSLSATGTITFTSEKQFDYIGIRSSSGAVYISSIEITCGSAGASYPATPKDQAIAWADYFIRETRTDETCLASSDDAKLAGLRSKWDTLADEYDWMVSGAKDEFCTSTDHTIVEAREHYKYIVSKFGASNLGSDGAFVTNGSNVPLSTKANNVMPLFNMSNQTSMIIIISFIGITSIGLYFFIKKRKEIE